MAWTSPRTWVSGEVPSAATLNLHVRDNLKALGDPWTSHTPTRTGFTISAEQSFFREAGKTIFWSYNGTISGASGSFSLSLPAPVVRNPPALQVVGSALAFDVGTAFHTAIAWVNGSGALNFTSHGTANSWSNTVPFTWAAGDTLSFRLVYERS